MQVNAATQSHEGVIFRVKYPFLPAEQFNGLNRVLQVHACLFYCNNQPFA